MRMTLWISGLLAATLALGACGGRRGGGGGGDDDDDVVGDGGSGLPPSEQVGDLSASDVQTLCDWSSSRQGGAGSVHECAEGLTVTTQPVSECVDTMSGTSCDITVGEVEDCTDAIAPDPCLLIEATPPACLPLLRCGQAGA
jgi:hypothetical protein